VSLGGPLCPWGDHDVTCLYHGGTQKTTGNTDKKRYIYVDNIVPIWDNGGVGLAYTDGDA